MIAKNFNIREIFATNNQKTIELEMQSDFGKVRSSVPRGTSTGKYEAVFLPPQQAIKSFNEIKKYFLDRDFANQQDVDQMLHTIDPSNNFKLIGGNVALAISSAFLKMFALEKNKEVFEYLTKTPSVPIPLCNVVGGWKGQSDVQEFLFFPEKQSSFHDSIDIIFDAYEEVARMLKEKDKQFVFAKNIESAWVSSLHIEKILKILAKITSEKKLRIGMDVAASQLWDGEKYNYKNHGEKLTRVEQTDYMFELAKKYPVDYIEDPFHEDDILGFSVLTNRIKPKLVCGDDFFATNLERLQNGIDHEAANAIIIKPNQVGTITDVIKVVNEAKRAGMKTVVSHRSGETEDTLICHLAVGLQCDFIKLGISGERTVKVNEMLRIEDKLK